LWTWRFMIRVCLRSGRISPGWVYGSCCSFRICSNYVKHLVRAGGTQLFCKFLKEKNEKKFLLQFLSYEENSCAISFQKSRVYPNELWHIQTRREISRWRVTFWFVLETSAISW
jgi:hypothetical protein